MGLPCLRLLTAFAGLSLLPACSTLTTGTDQDLTVATNPAGAACTLDRAGQRLAAVPLTPGSVKVSKSGKPIDVECIKPGFQTARLQHKSDFAGATLGNLILGGGIGLVVDMSTGASSVYPSEICVPLVADPNAPVPVLTVGSAAPNVAPRSRLHCPAAGTRARRSDGTVITYDGTDPANPDICLMTVNGRPTRLYFGLSPATGVYGGNAYAALMKVGAGQAADPYQIDGEFNAMFEDRWTLVGDETVKVNGQDRRASRLTHERSGTAGNANLVRTTRWIDQETGAELQATSEMIRGGARPAAAWTVVELTGPAGS